LLDRYLAQEGYEAQQTDEPVERERPNSMWEPLSGDRGARGSFGAEARDASMQFWLSRNRRPVLVAGLAVLAGWRALR
jgi:hypothetical protein